MALAVTALDVAFISAIAALASSVVSPLSAWLIAKGGRSHERRLAQDERIFDSRSRAYQDIMSDGRKDVRALHDAVDYLERASGEPPSPGVLGAAHEWADLEARALVFGSEEVVTRYSAYRSAMFRLGGAFRAVREGRLDVGGLRRLIGDAEDRLEELAKEMRANLS